MLEINHFLASRQHFVLFCCTVFAEFIFANQNNDHHDSFQSTCFMLQVVIQEALMLLSDCCRDDVASSRSKEAALKFIESFRNTKSLAQPKYISMTSETESQSQRC